MSRYRFAIPGALGFIMAMACVAGPRAGMARSVPPDPREQQCKDFFTDVIKKIFADSGITTPYEPSKNATVVLFKLTKEHFPETRQNDPEDNWKGSFWNEAEDLARDRMIIEKVVPYCSQPKFKDVGKNCPGFKTSNRQNWRDPTLWCTAARNSKMLFSKGIEKKIRMIAEKYSKHVMSKEKLRLKEGWLGNEGAVTFKEVSSFPQELKDRIQDELKAFYDAAGLPPNRDPAQFAPVDDAYAAFGKAVTELAPTFKMPEGTSKNPQLGIAKKVITDWHPKARILKVSMEDTDWKVEKGLMDSKGQIEARPVRRMSGYLLYKLPDEELCQLRSFDLRQYHTGGWGKTEAYMHFVRFQTCD